MPNENRWEQMRKVSSVRNQTNYTTAGDAKRRCLQTDAQEKEEEEEVKDGTLSKDQIVNALANLGYDAELSSGIVVIYVDTEDYIKNNRHKKYAKLMENLGYSQSWAVKPSSLRKGGADGNSN